MEGSLSVFSDYAFHKPELSSTDLASALLLLLGGSPADSVITNVSVIQSWNWFFMLTPFESIFLGFIIAQVLLLFQIAVLKILGVLPINLNKFANGDPAGRKKRHVGENLDHREKMAHTVVNVLKRMDRDECFVRALCLIQLREASSPAGKYRLPSDLKKILSALKISASRRKRKQPSPDDELSSALVNLEEAVQTGLNPCPHPHSNRTVCEERYSLCPTSPEDIYSYIDLIYEYFL